MNQQNQSTNNKQKAFTLAEVLITLGIIGVVAALTIPVLIQNADERATVTALKKTYSVLSSAYSLAVQDNGTPDTWGLTTHPPMLSILAPYLNVSKDCTDGSKGCFPTGTPYVYLASSLGNDGIYDNWGTSPRLRLNDGTMIQGQAASSTCGWSIGSSISLKNVCGYYFVDINGDKSPNQWGKDTFWFWLTKYGIVPAGSSQQTGSYGFTNECQNKDTMHGWGCAAWVLYNENTDYLNCNYLDWTGAKECN